ncbi:MAG: bifunctional phosphopantothenoylcysteine decarboxylase/phosphopantothenate--cysteine ligase CoaBC [Candidatus Levybacteria bacterium]|nr:bifunctional phosphopantothenoylcysteine decarboxylase/phosphopantothenate--cysteine ligase CoaBC [Candidatus Levybacteria bacterium]
MKYVNKTVVIGISGGIAAFKVIELIKGLKKENIDVFVIMTKSAEAFVNPEEFHKISGHKVFRTLFEENFNYKTILKNRKVDHIELADKADLFIIIPATANIIGKIAHGIADDFLTTTLLATQAPVMICPSMNVNMWANSVVQENVKKLQSLSYQFLGPDSGMLACGYEGKGRLTNVSKIKKEILTALYKQEQLKGKRIIVTAGGTREPIDNIRFITNRSSGKMGISIAEVCFLQGADVLLLRSRNAIKPRYPIQEATFETADELTSLVKRHASIYNICFHTAAVSDFKVAAQEGKIPSEQALTLRLMPRQKIYTQVKASNPKIKLIAFKAEWKKSGKELLEEARRKLHNSNIDFLVVNDVGKLKQGFDVDTNAAVVVAKNGTYKKFPLQSKRQLANALVEYII